MARPGRRRNAEDGGGIDEGPDLEPGWIDRVRTRLLAWYGRSRRDLPWRVDRDPYRILVSEFMLVQTTVAAVVPYFERFVARFPDVRALAESDPDEVLKHWEGLGYYRRARQLHDAARAVVALHDGRIPDDPALVQTLPGVGRYIAGAVVSFAHDRPAPILEANTQRVAARWLAWDEEIRSTRTQARLWRLAERVVPPENAGAFNQAFMELGATVCVPRGPLCLICPVRDECRAHSLGVQDRIPMVAPKAPPKDVFDACGLIESNGAILLVRRAPGQLWERFWEFPTIHRSGADPAGRSFGEPVTLDEGIFRLTGVRVETGPVVHAIRYGVTTHKVSLDVHRGRPVENRAAPSPGSKMTEAAWIDRGRLGELSLGAASRRLAGWLSSGE